MRRALLLALTACAALLVPTIVQACDQAPYAAPVNAYIAPPNFGRSATVTYSYNPTTYVSADPCVASQSLAVTPYSGFPTQAQAYATTSASPLVNTTYLPRSYAQTFASPPVYSAPAYSTTFATAPVYTAPIRTFSSVTYAQPVAAAAVGYNANFAAANVGYSQTQFVGAQASASAGNGRAFAQSGGGSRAVARAGGSSGGGGSRAVARAGGSSGGGGGVAASLGNASGAGNKKVTIKEGLFGKTTVRAK
jgi:hypothetical protein